MSGTGSILTAGEREALLAIMQGGFYGPEHAETVGVFEKANVVGAFGAKLE